MLRETVRSGNQTAAASVHWFDQVTDSECGKLRLNCGERASPAESTESAPA